MTEPGGQAVETSIRKKIYVSMTVMTCLCGIIVLIISFWLYDKELKVAMTEKIRVSARVAEHILEELKSRSYVAAQSIANDRAMVRALESNKRSEILDTATDLKRLAQVDYCTILDTKGIVLARTHEREIYGDSLAHLPHIKQAMMGKRGAFVSPGVTVRMGAYAGAPIFGEGRQIGIVSLGFALDNPELVEYIKSIIECEIGIFLKDERIVSTLTNDDGSYIQGERAPENIQARVLAGDRHIETNKLNNENALVKYVPILGAEDKPVGMLAIGYYTDEDSKKGATFFMVGMLITLGVLAICVVAARLIAGLVQGHLEKKMREVRQADEYAQLLLNATPLCCILFDQYFNPMDCNRASVETYKLKDKQEYLDRFFELSPEFQPNGRPSLEFSKEYIAKAYEDGHAAFEWMHQMLDGTPIPAEITLARVRYKDGYVVAGFTRDLREQKAVLSEIDDLDKTLSISKYELMKHKLTQNAMNIGLWDMEVRSSDPVNFGNRIEYSDEFRQMLGFSDESEFPNVLSSWSSRLHPEDRVSAVNSFSAHLNDYSGQTPFDIEYRLLKKNGNYRWFRALGETLRDEFGVPLRVAGALVDIHTSLTLSEIELMKYRLVSDALNIGLWDMEVQDAEDPIKPDTVFNWSQEFRQMLGYSDENDFPNLFSPVLESFHPDDRDMVLGAFAAHFNDRTGKTAYDVEYRLRLKNGQYRWFRANGDTLRDETGNPLSVAGALLDIHDEKQAKTQLEIMSSIVHNLPNFTSFKKLTGECLYVNPASSKLTGYSHEELMEDYISLLFDKETADDLGARVAKGLRKDGQIQYNFAAKMKSGEKRFFIGTSFMVQADTFATITTDVTDVRQTEIEKLAALEEIEYQGKLLSAANEASAMLLDINAESFEGKLSESMRIIGEALRVHRVAIWKNSMLEERQHYYALHEWVSERRPPITEHFVGPNVPFDDFMDGLYSQLSQGKDYACRVSCLPEKDQAQLRPQWIKSIFATPIFIKDEFWGFVGFDDCEKDRTFTGVEASILSSTGRLIGNAFYQEAAEKDANERINAMLDTVPLICNLWSKEGKVFDCNVSAPRLFGLDKDTYMGKFLELAPEFQPDGQGTGDKARQLLDTTFSEGQVIFEWMNQKLDGTPIPMEVTLTRVPYKGGYIAVGYGRDLREEKRMLQGIHYRDELLAAANEASALMLDINSESFEVTLSQSMKIIGEAVGLHHVAIWKNSVQDGRLHFYALHEWVSEQRPPITEHFVGPHIPYDEFLDGLYSQLSQGKDYACRVSCLPEKDQAQLRPQWVESIFATPIFVKDEFWGFVGFDDCVRDRAFTDVEANILSSVGRLFGNVFYQEAAEKDANERINAMLNTIPLICNLWSRDGKVFDCNTQAHTLFGMSKQDYMDQYYGLAPEFQPDGRRSADIGYVFLERALEDGKCIFEWTNQAPDGTLIPNEVTLTRVPYKGDYIAVGYGRDLREEKRMMQGIHYRDELMNAANAATAALLESRPETFSDTLTLSMRIIAEAVGLHRVCVWKNYKKDGRMRCMLQQEWVSEHRPPVSGEYLTDVPYDEVLPGWYDVLSHDKFLANVVCHMSPAEQAQFGPQNIQSIFVAPVFVKDVFWGFVGFDDCLNERDFTENEAMVLRSTGRLIGNAFFRHEMEREMAENHELNRIMFENAPVGLTLFDDNFKCIDCNESVLRTYGVTKEFYRDFFGSEAHSPKYQPDGMNSRDKALDVIQRVMDGETMKLEWTHKIPSGALLPVDLTMMRVMVGNKWVGLGYIYDLREHKLLQDALVEASMEAARTSDMMASILNKSEAMIYVSDIETDEILFISDCMKRHFGLEGDMKGKPCWKILQANMEGRCPFCPCHELDKDPGKVIIWDERNTVTNAYYRNYDRYIDWPGGKKVHIQFVTDMTSIKNAQEEVEAQDRLLQAVIAATTALLNLDTGSFEENLYQSMGLMAKAVNADRMYIWKNHTADGRLFCSQIYEWSEDAEPQQGKDFTNSLPYSDNLARWEELLSSGKCINSIVHETPKVEQDLLMSQDIKSILVMPVTVRGEFWGFVGLDDCKSERVFTDMEELILHTGSRLIANALVRNEMARETETALLMAKDASRAKSEFLSHISHEIRTPMNAVLGAAEIQLRKEEIPEDTEEALTTIYNSGNLLLNIINDILDISKIEASKLDILKSKYDIPSLIYDTMQINLLRFESKAVEFVLKIDEMTPQNMVGDDLRIKQVLNNIISNAFKYTEKGKIELSVRAEKDPDAEDSCILILSVSDTGQGMSQGQVEKIFDAYSRFNVEANRNIAGTGLGMNITKQLVDLMGGKIGVESEAGKGSTFTVWLPQGTFGTAVCGTGLSDILQSNNLKSRSRTKRVQKLHEHMPYGSVLIVDDVQSNLYVAKGMMLPYGLKIDTAINGENAVEKIKDGRVYDVIFMDHMMPIMDGMKATEIIRSLGYAKPIVALTANALSGQAEMFLANGFDAFISKPIDSRELNIVLEQMVRDKYPAEVVRAARLEKGQQKASLLAEPAKKAGFDKSMATAFLMDADSALSLLEELLPKIAAGGVGEADIKSFVTTVHGMKSASANIGEKALSDIAHKLEQAGNNGNFETISLETPNFISSLRTAVEKFKPAQTEGSNAVMSDGDLAFLLEKLGEIKAACDKYQIGSAKRALAALKEKTLPTGPGAVVADISTDLLRGNLKKAAASAEAVLKTYAAAQTKN
jgi:PAS domain S-box-containing protein